MTGSLNGRRRFRAASRRALLLLALAVPVLAVCDTVGVAEASIARAREVGLRVGFALEPPFAFVDADGEVRGEAPAVMRHVATALGIESLQWFPLEFDNLIPALEQGRIDVIASGLFITGERGRRVRFSRPTACLGPALVVHAEEDMSGHPAVCDTCTIAVLRGSVEQRALRSSAADSLLLTAPDLSTALAAVKSHDAAALAISAPTARMIVGRDSSLALRDSIPVALQSSRGCAALAFRPADRSLAAAFDSVLAQLVGSRTHQALVHEYGFTRRETACAAALPAGRAAPAAC